MKTLDLEGLTISALAPLLKKKEISPLEITKSYLERIGKLNPKLNAYLAMAGDDALAAARKAEKEIRQGKYRGPLHGMPLSIKDNIATKGVITTAGSKILADWVPDHDATVVERLKAAGAIILGKTNMHEWAKGSNSINPFYGTPLNPWDTARIPGGSSSGSAVAVAASLCGIHRHRQRRLSAQSGIVVRNRRAQADVRQNQYLRRRCGDRRLYCQSLRHTDAERQGLRAHVEPYGRL
jgi:Asp-tRNA(Asn)/Glu-tRNA(Gln) amidotransferase A subunit family amidase